MNQTQVDEVLIFNFGLDLLKRNFPFHIVALMLPLVLLRLPFRLNSRLSGLQLIDFKAFRHVPVQIFVDLGYQNVSDIVELLVQLRRISPQVVLQERLHPFLVDWTLLVLVVMRVVSPLAHDLFLYPPSQLLLLCQH